MRSNKGLVTAAVVILFLSVAGCGSALDALPGSGGGGGNKQSQDLTPELATGMLTGVVQDGVVSGADVNVYAWEGQKGELLASGTTDSRGRYSISLRVRSQPVLIEATGGRYKEEMTGKTVSLNDDQVLLALQNYTSGQRVASSLSYYTTLATGLAEHLVRLGTRSPDAVAEANDRVSRIIGVNASNVIPTDIFAPDNFSLPELQYGFATAALSSLTERSSILNGDEPHNVFTSILFIQSAYDDVRADGVLDGRGVNGEFTFGRIRLTPRLYRHELALHILRIANNQSANRTGLGARDMFELARRLNDSTDPIFGGEPVIPIDGDRPNVSAIAARQFPNLPDGAVVFGGLDLSAMVATFPGAASAELLLDGKTVIGTAANPEDPSIRLETFNPPIAEGPHTLALRVADISGAIGESPPLNVTISNQQTAIANVTIAGQPAGASAPLIVGKRAAVVTANIVDPARAQLVEYSVRAQGTAAFVPAATDIPNSGETALQSSASIALNQPQFADGDATLKVAVTNSAGFIFSREVPFIIDSQSPVIDRIFLDQIFRELPGGMFFDRETGEPCTSVQPPSATDSCLLYLQSGTINALVRENRAIDRVTLAAAGSTATVPGVPVSGLDNIFSFNLPLGPEGSEQIVTVTAIDKAQNTSVARQTVVFDGTAPTIVVSGLTLPGGGNILEPPALPITVGTDQIVFGGVVEDAIGLATVQLAITPGVPSSSSVVFMDGRTRARVEVRVDPSTIPSNITNFSVGIGQVVDRAGNFISGSSFGFTRALQ